MAKAGRLLGTLLDSIVSEVKKGEGLSLPDFAFGRVKACFSAFHQSQSDACCGSKAAARDDSSGRPQPQASAAMVSASRHRLPT